MAHMIRRGLRGLAAAFIALAACLAIAPTAAFADAWNENSLTVSDLAEGDTVTIYQVVKTVYNSETNVASNDFVTTFDEALDFDAWAALDSEDDKATVEAYADVIAVYVNTHKGDWGDEGYTMYTSDPVAADGGSVIFNNIEAGQYLVVVSNENDATRVYQTVIASVIPSVKDGQFVAAAVEAALKSSKVSLDKKINGDDSVDDVDAGDTVTFTITSTIPLYTSDLGNRVYTLTDVMSDGFSFTSDTLEVKVGNGTLTSGTDYTVSYGDQGSLFVLKLTASALKAYAGQALTVTYKATVVSSGEGVPAYDEAETNTAALEFSVNSIDDVTSELKDTVYMTVYGITFKKVGSNDETTGLAGAVFEVRDSSGAVIATATSGSDGTVTIKGALAANKTYTLVETKAPTGYDIADEIEFTISSDIKDDYSGALVTINGGTVVDPVSSFLTRLPVTGGTGTVLMTAAGVVLIAGAAAMIARSRKQRD